MAKIEHLYGLREHVIVMDRSRFCEKTPEYDWNTEIIITMACMMHLEMAERVNI